MFITVFSYFCFKCCVFLCDHSHHDGVHNKGFYILHVMIDANITTFKTKLNLKNKILLRRHLKKCYKI
jgi:hypothetical protein